MSTFVIVRAKKNRKCGKIYKGLYLKVYHCNILKADHQSILVTYAMKKRFIHINLTCIFFKRRLVASITTRWVCLSVRLSVFKKFWSELLGRVNFSKNLIFLCSTWKKLVMVHTLTDKIDLGSFHDDLATYICHFSQQN